VTEQVGNNYEDYRYVFRVNPPNAIRQAQQTADFLTGVVRDEMGISDIAVIHEDATASNATIDAVLGLIEGEGFNITTIERFDVSTTDFTPILARVADSGAGFAFTFISGGEGDIYIRQWAQSEAPFMTGGFNTKSQDANFYDRTDGLAYGEIVGGLLARAEVTEATLPYLDLFQETYGREPVYTGPGAYDAVLIYADAVERAGTTETDAVIEALEETDHTGVIGRLVFNEEHDIRTGPGYANMVFLQWQEGGERVIVSPQSLRNGDLVYPDWIAE
jgi:branched-chain amino acid transport system substrate-binding protein